MTRIRIIFLACLVLAVGPAIAGDLLAEGPAAPATSPGVAAMRPVLEALAQLIVVIVGALASWILISLRTWLRGKGIETELLTRERIDYYSGLAARKVEEATAGRVPGLAQATGTKLDRAVDDASRYLPGVAREVIRESVLAQLPTLGIGAAGKIRALEPKVRELVPAAPPDERSNV